MNTQIHQFGIKQVKHNSVDLLELLMNHYIKLYVFKTSKIPNI